MASPLELKLTIEGRAAEASLAAFVRQLDKINAAQKAAGQSGAESADQIGAAFERAGQQAAPIPPQLNQVADSSTRAARQIGNITAQFNDIGVMLAAGQSPLMLAIQQGTQLNQIFAGQGMGSVLAQLKAGFLALLSPVSLLTIGLIAGGAALGQWAIEAASAAFGTEDLATKVEALEKATSAYESAAKASFVTVDELRKKYGAMAESVKLAREELAKTALAAAQSALRDVSKDAGFVIPGVENRAQMLLDLEALYQRVETAAQKAGGAGSEDLLLAEQAFKRLQFSVDSVESNLQALAASYGISVEQAEKLAVATAALNQAQGVDNQVAAASALSAVMVEVFGSIERADAATGGMAAKLQEAIIAGADIASSMNNTEAATEAATEAIGGAVVAVGEMTAGIGEALFGQLELNAAASGLSGYFAAAQGPLSVVVGQLWEGAKAAYAMQQAQVQANRNYGKLQNQAGGGPDAVRGSAMNWDRPVITAPQPTGAGRVFVPTGSSGAGAGGGGGGGGAPARDSFDGLVKQAEAAMTTLQRATDTVNFKVKEGMLSTAQGVDAISKAKASAADQLATLIPQIEKVSETAGPKAAAQVEKWRAAFSDLAKDVKAVSSDLSKNLSSGFESAFADFMRNAKSGSEAFEAFGQSIIDQMAKIASQRVTANFITPLIDSVIGSIFPSAKGNVIAKGEVQAFAKGGTPDAPLSAYSESIVSQPTLFPMAKGTGMMGEAGPEAIMPLQGGGVLGLMGGKETRLPLKRGSDGRLGVVVPQPFAKGGMIERGQDSAVSKAMGAALQIRPSLPAGVRIPNPLDSAAAGLSRQIASAAPSPVNVQTKTEINITTPPGTKAEVSERREGGATMIDVILEQVEGRMASNLSRGVGPFADVLGGQFGARRLPGGA